MQLILIILMFIALISCKNNQSLLFDKLDVERIDIKILDTGDAISIQRNEDIQKLLDQLSNCIGNIVKFKPTIKIEIFAKADTLLLLNRENYIKYKGQTFELKEKLSL